MFPYTRRPKFKALWTEAFPKVNADGPEPVSFYGLRKRSQKMALAMRQYVAEKKEFLIQNPRCEYPSCDCTAVDVHHSRGRIGRLLMDHRFWVPLCRKHHNWVLEHPDQARELGLLPGRGQYNTPVPQEVA